MSGWIKEERGAERVGWIEDRDILNRVQLGAL